MDNRYNQSAVVSGVTRFDKAPESEAQFSRMRENPRVVTAFNAGDIVPVKCIEILPGETYSVSVQEVIRQTTLKTPTMGEMICDMYAFFVPNRVVNESWKNVQGENSSGSWNAPDVNCAPLYNVGQPDVQIPVGSVADFYGLPTQKPLPAEVLTLMNDFPFRGYLAIYNEYFRDQNYQPPIPFSKLNVFEGFLFKTGSYISLDGSLIKYGEHGGMYAEGPLYNVDASGAFGGGAISKAIYGEGMQSDDICWSDEYDAQAIVPRRTSWSALDAPLKANKLHDALTSVLPSPQKGPQVSFSLAESAPLTGKVNGGQELRFSGNPFIVNLSSGTEGTVTVAQSAGSYTLKVGEQFIRGLYGLLDNGLDVSGTVDLSAVSGISVDDIRLGFALQQLYELYGRSGSRYRELCHALFGVSADDPYMDIPKMLGHIRVPLELYQTAQTSASVDDSPQGNLAAFGYTNKGGFLFKETFLEHGYVHILVVVRQRNLYPAYLAPHWFRVNKLDFYTPLLANISEQPVLLRTINPFHSKANSMVFGYQEAWWEYRQHPDEVTGYMRSGIADGLSAWTYQDKYVSSQLSADSAFMESNAQEVLDETIAVTSENGPQFKALFSFTFDHVFPGPVYSVPGLDVV